MSTTATAPGKIILSGEYAVVFGHTGIAVPAGVGVTAKCDTKGEGIIEWSVIEEFPEWNDYLQTIITHCIAAGADPNTYLHIEHTVPLGKGMGSSTAVVIAVARALLGPDCRKVALEIEDTVNPGHSGVDFNVIWEGKPIQFIKGEGIEVIDLPADLLEETLLIDTGPPDQATPELVAWVKEREDELKPHLATIGECTQQLRDGSADFMDIIRRHHAAQVALGVVPEPVQELIATIEAHGGAAKVLGAGSRTGGGGMVLAKQIERNVVEECGYEVIEG